MKKSKQWKARRHAASVQRKVAKQARHTRRYPERGGFFPRVTYWDKVASRQFHHAARTAYLRRMLG